jgi:hypothetical protein
MSCTTAVLSGLLDNVFDDEHKHCLLASLQRVSRFLGGCYRSGCILKQGTFPTLLVKFQELLQIRPAQP